MNMPKDNDGVEHKLNKRSEAALHRQIMNAIKMLDQLQCEVKELQESQVNGGGRHTSVEVRIAGVEARLAKVEELLMKWVLSQEKSMTENLPDKQTQKEYNEEGATFNYLVTSYTDFSEAPIRGTLHKQHNPDTDQKFYSL